LLAERSEESDGDGTNASNQLTTLRKEAFVTWKLTKTTKKRTADALNDGVKIQWKHLGLL
jgi:hypothetical protein